MTKEEAVEIITQFEAQADDQYITRKEAIRVMTAMNVFTLYEISSTIMTDFLDNSLSNLRKI